MTVRTEEQLEEWLELLASSEPAPGGGAAAAVSCSMGASLVEMVCNLTIGKEKYAAHEDRMRDALSRATALRRQALKLADADAVAFRGVIAAYGLPKKDQAEKEARRAAIQTALLAAADVPARTAQCALEVAELCREILDGSNVNVISDVAVAALCAKSALAASVVNIEVNISALSSAEERSRLQALVERLEGSIDPSTTVERVRHEAGPMKLIDGKEIAKEINAATRAAADALSESGVQPCLAIVVPTDDEATAWYVRSIRRAAKRVGILCEVRECEGDGSLAERALREYSESPSVHGIICQTPLPEGYQLHTLAALIAPEKDVDGATATSLGGLVAGSRAFAPATAEAVLEIVRREVGPLDGKRVTVVGRSTVVGLPAALLSVASNATVAVCHSRTADLVAECQRADVLVAAVGRAHLLNQSHVGAGAIVIDVGTNAMEDGSLLGDVEAKSLEGHASAVTPVPGGVGPVTTAILLRHVVEAAQGAT